MPSLTPWLQTRFEAYCPQGWRCRREAPLVDEAASRRLGFRPRADVLLEHGSSGRRVWVEFEVSRADPVANHAKFATSRFFEDLPPGDSFVSMTSRHIEPGRAALAAGTAAMMRALGIPAFQVMLLPQFDGPAVKHLNSLPRPQLDEMALSVEDEVTRVLEVTNASALSDGHRIHKADNPWTVSMNVRRWNLEMAQPDLAALWGRRPVQYFAFDPSTGQFAPSKFCAFIPGANLRAQATGRVLANDAAAGGHAWSLALQAAAHVMTLELYTQLGEGDARFDGNIARRHLEQHLRYERVLLRDAPEALVKAFGRWHGGVAGLVPLRGEPWVLVPAVSGLGKGAQKGSSRPSSRR